MRITALHLILSFFTLIASATAQVSEQAHPDKKKFSLTPVADEVANLEDFPAWFLSNGLHHTHGLVAWFPFNGHAYDESGSGLHSTLNGPQLTRDRHNRIDRAYFFDGLDDYIRIEHNPKANPKNFTLCVWVNPDKGKAGIQTVLRNTHHPAGKGFLIYYRHRAWAFWTGSPAWSRIDQPKAFAGIWTHLTFSFYSDNESEKGVMTTYINGQKNFSKPGRYSPNPSHGLGIGGNGNKIEHPSLFFRGCLDNIRIYNYALNESEIASLYKLEK